MKKLLNNLGKNRGYFLLTLIVGIVFSGISTLTPPHDFGQYDNRVYKKRFRRHTLSYPACGMRRRTDIAVSCRFVFRSAIQFASEKNDAQKRFSFVSEKRYGKSGRNFGVHVFCQQ